MHACSQVRGPNVPLHRGAHRRRATARPADWLGAVLPPPWLRCGAGGAHPEALQRLAVCTHTCLNSTVLLRVMHVLQVVAVATVDDVACVEQLLGMADGDGRALGKLEAVLAAWCGSQVHGGALNVAACGSEGTGRTWFLLSQVQSAVARSLRARDGLGKAEADEAAGNMLARDVLTGAFSQADPGDWGQQARGPSQLQAANTCAA